MVSWLTLMGYVVGVPALIVTMVWLAVAAEERSR